MTVALVLMESPAIIMGVLLANWVRSRDQLQRVLSSRPVSATRRT
jgi:hypothetical protein